MTLNTDIDLKQCTSALTLALFSLNLFSTRDEADGIYYKNKELFAVDESVQREALKDFYEQRAQVKGQDSQDGSISYEIRWRRKS